MLNIFSPTDTLIILIENKNQSLHTGLLLSQSISDRYSVRRSRKPSLSIASLLTPRPHARTGYLIPRGSVTSLRNTPAPPSSIQPIPSIYTSGSKLGSLTHKLETGSVLGFPGSEELNNEETLELNYLKAF